MNMFRIFILIVLTCGLNSQLEASLFKRKLNYLDENKMKQGKWVSYWNDTTSVIQRKYFFVDNKETRMTKFYHDEGTIHAKFRYYSNKIRVKYFNKKRILQKKGWAKMEYSNKEIRYYWEGKWKFYNNFRTKISESEYLDGNMISERSFKK